MKRVCRDCSQFKGFQVDPGRRQIFCDVHGRVAGDPSSYVCQQFTPKFPDDASIAELRNFAEQSGLTNLQEAIERWLIGPPSDVTVRVDRRPFLFVSDAELADFEGERELCGPRSERLHNHAFFDLLVPVGSRLARPWLFWVSPSNPPAVDCTAAKGMPCAIIVVGPGYAFGQTAATIAWLLREEGVQARAPWFRELVEKSGVAADDPVFESLYVLGSP
jgi:hypothetical protein